MALGHYYATVHNNYELRALAYSSTPATLAIVFIDICILFTVCDMKEMYDFFSLFYLCWVRYGYRLLGTVKNFLEIKWQAPKNLLKCGFRHDLVRFSVTGKWMHWFKRLFIILFVINMVKVYSELPYTLRCTTCFTAFSFGLWIFCFTFHRKVGTLEIFYCSIHIWVRRLYTSSLLGTEIVFREEMLENRF